MKTTLLIMAAGIGSRFGTGIKQLEPVDDGLQNRIIACHGVGCDLRMYVQQSDFTIHSTAERLDQILKLDESCDYFYKIRIPQQIRKQLLAQLDAMGFHESSIYPDMEHIAKEQADSHFNF